MLLYEYEIRDRLDALTEYARNVLGKFESGAEAEDLLLEAKNLEQLHNSLNDVLPAECRHVGNFGRHVSWMIRHLSQGSTGACRSDIDDICKHDIRAIEAAFRKWCKRQEHYDSELRTAVSGLILRQEYDSAVRKAFVVLKARLVRLFNAPDTLDGSDLVNMIFGRSSSLAITDAERQAIRDLLAGLYGSRNHAFQPRGGRGLN